MPHYMLIPPYDHPTYESIHARQYISLASLICLIWEYLLTLDLEYTHVWKSQISITKWLYLLLRYVTLICQISNHVVATYLFSRPPISAAKCAGWFAFQSAYVQTVLVLFELILFVRVYALYQKAQSVMVFLGAVHAFEVTTMVYMAVRINKSLQYDETCLVAETPMEALGVTVVPVITQIIVWGMTWYKQAFQKDRTSSPIVNMVFRDGLAIFLVVCLIFSLPVSYSLRVHVLTHNIWSIMATVLSISGCRIIMNMRRIKLRPPQTEIELDSCFASQNAYTEEMTDHLESFSI
ncbi:hypothetical protein B0H34DRAFT_717779 [Crassisporium funariophilum]|nr:hypothetical protein B0H34DRAFT_717779 [Crassisporium funariophilum]